jgi:hypothetical protein
MSTNGTTNYLDTAQNAAQQAVKDLAQFDSNNNQAVSSMAVGAIAPIIGAIGSIAGAAAGTGNFGINLAGLANSSSGSALEVEISNYSSQPIALFNYNPSVGNVTKIPQPLVQGENDIFLLTHSSSFSTSTSISLQFMVGLIEVDVTFSYTDSGDPGRWQITVSIDGDSPHKFATKLQLFGVTFQGNSGYPSFSLYTSPIETSSGQIDLIFYDLAS